MKNLNILVTLKRIRLEFLLVTLFFAPLFFWGPLRIFLEGRVQAFDYGIMYESLYRIYHNLEIFLYSRGTYIWADDQSYIQYFLSWVIASKYSHYLIITLHSLASFLLPISIYIYTRSKRLSALFLSVSLFLNHGLINQSHDLIHPETFVTPLIFWWAIAFYHGRIKSLYLLTFACLICKEDIAIYIGGFSFFTYFFKLNFKTSNRHALIILAISLILFIFNLKFIHPIYAKKTCDFLQTSITNNEHTLPWLQGLYTNFSSFSYYSNVFFKWKVLKYLGLCLWPLFFILPISFKWLFLVIPPIFVNIITGSDYLISGNFHYDHSVIPLVAFIFVVNLREKSFLLFRTLLTCFFALILHFSFNLHNLKIYTHSHYFKWPSNNHLKAYKEISDYIPPHSIVSVPSWNLPYFINLKKKVYMFPNPLTDEYFGINGKCQKNIHVDDLEYIVLSKNFIEKDRRDLKERVYKDFKQVKEANFTPENPLILLKRKN